MQDHGSGTPNRMTSLFTEVWHRYLPKCDIAICQLYDTVIYRLQSFTLYGQNFSSPVYTGLYRSNIVIRLKFLVLVPTATRPGLLWTEILIDNEVITRIGCLFNRKYSSSILQLLIDVSVFLPFMFTGQSLNYRQVASSPIRGQISKAWGENAIILKLVFKKN